MRTTCITCDHVMDSEVEIANGGYAEQCRHCAHSVRQHNEHTVGRTVVVDAAEEIVAAVDSCRDCSGELVAYSDRYGESMPSEHYCGRCLAMERA